jgi:uroporphyrinogen decarboxylase
MRQAGRYLPEYRALRLNNSFNTLIHTPELAAQVTHLPIDRFHFDAAILFSDILVITEPFGFTMEFKESGGMQLVPPQKDITLSIEQILHYVPETIRLLKKTLPVPLIGFCGGPYTVCSYMERLTPSWLSTITEATITYLKMQIDAGVDAIQIFDSWAGLLSPSEFHTLTLPYLTQIMDAIRPLGVPIILFCRGSCRYISELSALQPAAIGFDWEMAMDEIQGNLDPALLSGPRENLERAVDKLLDCMQDRPGYIFNLGHGIQPDASLENVEWLVRRIKNLTTSQVEA